jgi:hypothetical protein
MQGPLLPKLRGQFAEFLQHRSLKRLGILYQSTCVGFGYGLGARAVSRKTWPRPPNPIRANTTKIFVTSGRLGTINPIPIGYGFRPRLRGPAHPARINLAQEPLDFRRQSFSLCLSLLMSAFSLPIPPACLAADLRRPTERSATTQMPSLASESAASVRGLSPVTFSARDGLTRPVSYYAFFKGWLLLSQPPGCLGLPTSFPTEPRFWDLSWRSGLFPSRPRTLAPMVWLPTSTRRYSEFG